MQKSINVYNGNIISIQHHVKYMNNFTRKTYLDKTGCSDIHKIIKTKS